VSLLAVSKGQSAEAIRAAADCGQRDFGENYIQEALAKMERVGEPGLCWHFIGRIQSNKTRDVAAHFDWVHSVDRVRIASRLSEARPQGRAPLNVCIQVNIDAQPTKAGVAPEALPELAAAVAALPGLCLRGLMAMPAPASDIEAQRRPFRALRECLEELRAAGFPLDTLSMGTTADLRAAVAEGATMVRVGTGVFGPRPR
jgi:pyridoxal phosphate enzyme (YggS family)